MHLCQVVERGRTAVALRDGPDARLVHGVGSSHQLAQEAIGSGRTLAEAARARGLGASVDLAAALDEGRVLAPISHPDPRAPASDRHRADPPRQRGCA